jgi:hypothetical protein
MFVGKFWMNLNNLEKSEYGVWLVDFWNWIWIIIKRWINSLGFFVVFDIDFYAQPYQYDFSVLISYPTFMNRQQKFNNTLISYNVFSKKTKKLQKILHKSQIAISTLKMHHF